jgi:hypothetical protein
MRKKKNRLLKLRFKHKFRAITLMELLIYLALFGVIFVSVLQFTLQVEENNRRSLNHNLLQKYSIYLNQHMAQAVDDTDSVDIAGSTFANSQGVLDLNPFAGGAITYRLTTGQLSINRGSGAVNITPSYLTIDNFTVERIRDSAGGDVGVKITVHMYSNFDSDVDNTLQTNYMFP